jgi:ureidoglycolate hydrolase
MEVIKATPLSFIKYGKVVNPPSCAPTSEARDYKFWSNLADYFINGETEIGICTVYKQSQNIVEGMERHLNTPEILIPVDAPFILPVLVDGDPDSSAKAFKVEVGESIIINNAVWHGACLPFGKNKASYFVIFKKGTPAEDVEKKTITKVNIRLND